MEDSDHSPTTTAQRITQVLHGVVVLGLALIACTAALALWPTIRTSKEDAVFFAVLALLSVGLFEAAIRAIIGRVRVGGSLLHPLWLAIFVPLLYFAPAFWWVLPNPLARWLRSGRDEE